MDKTYVATVTFGSRQDGLLISPFVGSMTWVEDDSEGGPTNESVVACLNDEGQGMFEALSCHDIKEVK